MILDKIAPAVVAFAAFFALTVSAPAATAKNKVKVQIQVIEAAKTAKPSMPKNIRPEIADEITSLGFTSATITDQIAPDVEHAGSFSLEILDKKNKRAKHTVRVTVLDKKKDEIVLRIVVPSMKIATDTKHKNGGTFLIASRRAGQKALFLAVTPIP